METKGHLLGISLATVMVVMVKEEVSKVLTTVVTTPLMMPAAVVAVGAVAAAAAPPLEVHRLSAPFLFAEIKHKLSFNSVITKLLKMYTIPEINTSS